MAVRPLQFAAASYLHKRIYMGCVRVRLLATVLLLSAAPACATLESLRQFIQPPRFRQAQDRVNEVRLVGPSASSMLGGARVRIWTTVTNPNPFGFTLSTIDAELYLDDQRAADGTFPLGLPLEANEKSTIPIDFTLRFQDIPGLAAVVRQAASGRSLPYRIDGTIGVEAGRFGSPTFGPLTLFEGELH
jgi:hypothetical protein